LKEGEVGKEQILRLVKTGLLLGYPSLLGKKIQIVDISRLVRIANIED